MLTRGGYGEGAHMSAASGNTTPLLSCQGIVKRYPLHEVNAVNDVSFEVNTGEAIALMGPSGCGKTTLLNLLGAMDVPDSGLIELSLGNETLRVSTLNDSQRTAYRRQTIGFIFQFFHLLPTLTVAENIALPLWLNKAPAAQSTPALNTLLDELGLTDRRDFYPKQLSGGQMQRTAIARALIHQPKLVIADEPTGNLDSHNGDMVLQLLLRMCRERNATLIMATHSTDAAAACSRTLRMKDGQLIS